MNFYIETLSGRKLTKNLKGSPVKATEFEKLEFVAPPGGFKDWDLLYKTMKYAGSKYVNDENYATHGNPQNTYTGNDIPSKLDYIFYKRYSNSHHYSEHYFNF